MSETKQMETSEQTTFNLTLSDVPYDDKYRLNQASATQLVKGLQEMVSRLTEPQNDYQKELYPSLKNIVTKLVDKYNVVLEGTTEVEREVRRFNLHGYNGRVKKPIATKGVKYNLVYKYANFGDYLKTLTQRLSYLVDRPVPQRYVTNTTEGAAHNQMKTMLVDYLKYLKDDVETDWNTAVTSARTAGGSSVQENLRKRTEKTLKKQGQDKSSTPTFQRRNTQPATQQSSQSVNHSANRGRPNTRGSATVRGRGRGGRTQTRVNQ